jgi:oligoribonuclease NrnB/cAMP/cGMP phosphodiesterase (DHH superfamily)
MLDDAESITILDHHISAQSDLSHLLSSGKIQSLFDLSRSGAMIAWNWFFPDEAAPKLIAHIQDRDLWQFKLPETRHVTTGLSSYPYDFELWDRFMFNKSNELDDLIRDGKAIERKLQTDISELIATGIRRMIIGGYEVPVLNVSSAYVSDAANIISVGEPFAACYWDHSRGRSFSLRVSDSDVDVSKVAKLYGGGGHIKAAGFTVDIGWEGE